MSLQEERPLFSIGAVARQLALPPATIRTWETRYALVVPERTAGGQRLYTRAQVEQLRHLKASVAAGARPAEAHRILAAEEEGHDGDDAVLRALLARQGIRVADGVELEVVEPGEARPGRTVAVVTRRA